MKNFLAFVWFVAGASAAGWITAIQIELIGPFSDFGLVGKVTTVVFFAVFLLTATAGPFLAWKLGRQKGGLETQLATNEAAAKSKLSTELRNQQAESDRELKLVGESHDQKTSELSRKIDALQQVDRSRRDLRRLLRTIYLIATHDAPASVSRLEWSVVALLVGEDGESLERVGSLTLRRGDVKTNIQFRKGKGVVGRALEAKKTVLLNLDREDVKVAIGDESPEKWDELPEKLRMGLTHAETKGIEHYTTVFATPVFEGQKVVGVISVTGPKNSYQHLSNKRSLLATTSASATTPFQVLAHQRTVTPVS